MHFFNPAYIMKLVEVVKGNQTDDEIAKAIYKLLSNKNLRQEIGSAAKIHSEKLFSPGLINQKWEFLYTKTIKEFYESK